MAEPQRKDEARVREQEKPDALAKIVAKVAEDASQAPSRYLKETVVPEGGE